MTRYVTRARIAAAAGIIAVATLAPQVSAAAATTPHFVAAAVPCQTTAGGVGQHTLSERCLVGSNIKHWRIVVTFCTTANCGQFGGTTQTVSGAVSKATNSGAYVNGAPDGGPDFYVETSTT